MKTETAFDMIRDLGKAFRTACTERGYEPKGGWDGDFVVAHVEADAVGVGAFARDVAAVGCPLAAEVVRRVRYADGAALFVGLAGADGGRC